VALEVPTANDGRTVFRAFDRAEFLEWPAWLRLRAILCANGGSYGLSGPRGAGKSWLMQRAIEWIESDERKAGRAGIGLWYPSPSEYDPLAFLASLSDSLATKIESWYRHNRRVQSRTLAARVAVFAVALAGFLGVLLVPAVRRQPVHGALALMAAAGVVAALCACVGVSLWRYRWAERRLLREALVVRERARYTATQRESSDIGAQGGRGITASVKRVRERQLVERPATLSSLVSDFRALAAEAAEVTGGVVIAIDELDKMAEPDKARALLRDVKAVFEVRGVHFLVSVSDEAARTLNLGALASRNEFNSSFYTVLQAQPATPEDCAELLEGRGSVPREVSVALAVLAGGNPREVVRLADLAGRVTTGVEAAMLALGEEALALRREIVAAENGHGPASLGLAAREAAYLAVPDEAFERPDQFVELCRIATEPKMWAPSWADAGWAPFEEPWRRLMVRLAVAGRLSQSRSILEDGELTDRLLDVVVAAGQASHVAKLILERNLRLETRRPGPAAPSVSEIRKRLTELAREYETTRASMESGGQRTRAMEDIVQRARRLGRDAAFTSEDVIGQLRGEKPGDRVVGLAVIQATADPATVRDVLGIVREPATPFEQYQALRALESLRPNLSPDTSSEVVDVLSDSGWRDALKSDSGRLTVADRILKGLRRPESKAA
jgi:KAP family P-loop domain